MTETQIDVKKKHSMHDIDKKVSNVEKNLNNIKEKLKNMEEIEIVKITEVLEMTQRKTLERPMKLLNE